ncbi:MAG: hypothetical protein IPM91_05525 [Bacteroidetes bacterium]|nr:hypothetical protein [Bacteroidota bacterium]
MNQLNRMLNSIVLATVLALLFTGCYYVVEEALYPSSGTCDTSNITYANTIAPIMTDACVSCHSGGAPSGNIDLSSYANVKIQADNGALYGSMNHDPNWSAMPQGGNKTDACTLLKIQTWINKGTPNQ